LIRTNLTESEVKPRQESLTQSLFDHIPVGVGTKGVIPASFDELDLALELGLDWSLSLGYAWPEDLDHCEENGRMPLADASNNAV